MNVSVSVQEPTRTLLGERFACDGRPTLPLNDLQRRAKAQIDRKVDQGIYRFESEACCICGDPEADTLATKDRYGLYMPVVLCKGCGLIYTNPRMNQEAYARFYNSEYRPLYGGTASPTEAFFEEQYAHGRRIFAYLTAHCRFSRPLHELRVLEVGCGAGGILKYFQERGCRVKGIDLGEAYVRFGRDRYGLDLSVGTLADCAIDEAPDCILYSHVLEHILDPNQELQRIRRLLPARGLLYIELPGVKNLMHSYRMDFLRLLQNAHTYHFTRTTLAHLLGRNGFEMIAGDETIRSVFQPSSPPTDTVFASDYAEVLAYLLRVERRRRLLPFPPYVLRQPGLLLPRILKRLGLADTVR